MVITALFLLAFTLYWITIFFSRAKVDTNTQECFYDIAADPLRSDKFYVVCDGVDKVVFNKKRPCESACNSTYYIVCGSEDHKMLYTHNDICTVRGKTAVILGGVFICNGYLFFLCVCIGCIGDAYRYFIIARGPFCSHKPERPTSIPMQNIKGTFETFDMNITEADNYDVDSYV